MRQVLQRLSSGETVLANMPLPASQPEHLLIRSCASLLSLGTERMLVEFSKGSLLQKARSQPDKVKQVIDKVRTDGLAPTLEAVFRKLDEPIALGYCNAGVVLESAPGRCEPAINQWKPGDRVASNGPHAEIVSVPHHLCAKIPDEVLDEEAAFTVVGAIALQGIRLSNPTLGEKFMVIGLGLIGQLTVQLLRANGCQVLGVDLSPDRLKLARDFGADVVPSEADAVKAAEAWTAGAGVDGVIITASASTDEIMHQAAQACRKRGRIVLVGVVGLHLRRDDFYKKEITFQVSCSYGPGRYDEAYEQRGRDYPLAYVRWTEQRNFEAVLQAMKEGRLNVKPLITHRFSFDDALAAYETVQKDSSPLGILLEYTQLPSSERSVVITAAPRNAPSRSRETQGDLKRDSGSYPVIGVIGAGNFANAVLLPALAKTAALRSQIAARNPVHAQHAARKYGFQQATTDYMQILRDPAVNAVFILTGHNTHARFICEALQAGKHVFVEKPLCLNEEELQQIERCFVGDSSSEVQSLRSGVCQLMVGFNRRFSPHVREIKKWLQGRVEPLCMNMTVNAGAIPPEHWSQDPNQGGGRIIGEACHFIDLLLFMAEAPVVSVSAVMVGEGPAVRTDKMSIQLGFADGSVGTVNYFANGSKSYPKEVLEVFSDGRIVRLDNFRTATGFGFKGSRSFRTWRQDKGHNAEIMQFIDRVAVGEEPLIPFGELANVTRATFAAMASANSGERIKLG